MDEKIKRHTLDSTDSAEYYFTCGANRLYDIQFNTVISNLNFDTDTNKKRIKALDIGCSGGRYALALANIGLEVVGIDTAIKPLIFASMNINANFVRASVTKLPFKYSLK